MKQIKGIKRENARKKAKNGMRVDSKSVFLIQRLQNERKWALENGNK
jgi:hypothetical protein